MINRRPNIKVGPEIQVEVEVDFSLEPDPELSALIARAPKTIDRHTHRLCFDYAMALLAAGGDPSRVKLH